MTLGTYAHVQPAQDRAAAELLAALCDGGPPEAVPWAAPRRTPYRDESFVRYGERGDTDG